MKPLRTFIAFVVLSLPPCIALAGDGDIDFSCVTRKVDQKTTQSGTDTKAIIIDTEDWQYVVTLANNTFNDMKDIEVRYIIFTKSEELGTVAGVRVGRQYGSAKIDVLKAHDKTEFNTDAVKLQKASLPPTSYYPNGARMHGEASLSGLWIRIYQNGNLIAEMSRPSDLASKEKWGQ